MPLESYFNSFITCAKSHECVDSSNATAHFAQIVLMSCLRCWTENLSRISLPHLSKSLLSCLCLIESLCARMSIWQIERATF